MRKLKNSELNRLSLEDFKIATKLPLIIVLDNIRSLNNIGSVFRTADAFLIEKIFLCGISAQPPHRDIQKTALGSTDSVEWEYVEKSLNCVQDLQNRGYNCIAVEQAENSISLTSYEHSSIGKIALVFGNEVRGVQQNVLDICDKCIEIPQLGTKHSLNISVSAGIIMWDFFKRHQNIKA
ncbi:MAG: RNA methyltransferase [Flavobacteriales bacterium]|nr:RNA methyltransferase [Flavobacteriales bacterium]|tara:strand:- start:13422 stop:13961 length:540 start_codon:yes stop_codon:yes gene_type:complete